MGTARERECGSGDWPRAREREKEGAVKEIGIKRKRRGKKEPHDYIPACTWSVSNLCVQVELVRV
jgi:hypothetical protein